MSDRVMEAGRIEAAATLTAEVEKEAEVKKTASKKKARDAADNDAGEKTAQEAADKLAAKKAAQEAADKQATEKAAQEAADKHRLEEDQGPGRQYASKGDQTQHASGEKEHSDRPVGEADRTDTHDSAHHGSGNGDSQRNQTGEDGDGTQHATGEHQHADEPDGSGERTDTQDTAHDGSGNGERDQTGEDGNSAQHASAEEEHSGRTDGDHEGSREGDGTDSGPPKPSIVLTTANATDQTTDASIVGTNNTDNIAGGQGNDTIVGRKGEDVIHGDEIGTFSAPIKIEAALINAAQADAISLLVSGLPPSASLSAGHDNGNGTWSLTIADLSGLTITAPDAGAFKLHVVAKATDGSGLSASSDILVTLSGGSDDTIAGGQGNDVLFGDQGDDVIYGGSIPTGAVSPPHIDTVADNDTIHGGDGNDHIWGNSGDDVLYGDTGNDVIYGGKGNDTISGGVGDDVLHGNSGNDLLDGGAGDNQIFGESGDDHIVAAGGNDTISGGSGFDTLDFSRATNGVTVDMSKGTATGFGTVTFTSIEHVIGSSYDDAIKGSSRAEVIDGGAGHDNIRSMAGADTLTGGDGHDTFVYFKKDVFDGVKELGTDHILDFSMADTLDLRDIAKGNAAAISIAQDADGATHVFAKMSGQAHEVAILDNFHDHTVADMIHNGMILV